MRKILFAFLSFLSRIQKISRAIRGLSEEDAASQRIVSGKAWEDFCDQLKLAKTNLHLSGAPDDVFNQSEGLRYLTRLTRAGLEAFVEFADPSFPVFKRMVHETVKMGADNPDNYYFNATISGEFEYKICGKRNTIDYIGFFTQNGSYGTTGGLAYCGALEGKDLVLEEDGSFEIILSKVPRGKNWLKIEKESSLVMVRQTFFNRFEEIPAEIEIENLSGQETPDPISPKLIDEGLRNASMFVAGASLLFSRWAAGFKKHVNTLPQFDPDTSLAAGGDAKIIYYHSYWNLKNDEALVIQVRPPECDNWNFQLNNYWMESLDYRYFTVCINKGSADIQEDGSVRIVVSHQHTGLPNELNTCSHSEGTMCWRWYRLAPGVEPVEPECQVVKLKELEYEFQ